MVGAAARRDARRLEVGALGCAALRVQTFLFFMHVRTLAKRAPGDSCLFALRCWEALVQARQRARGKVIVAAVMHDREGSHAQVHGFPR